MRSVPSYLAERLRRSIQTRANDSAPSVDIWVGRPSTVLVDDKFLERQTVLKATVSDVSIAVCHPRVKRNNTHIYMAYVSNGVAHVVDAKHKTKMPDHEWRDTGFERSATAVSIAFDGTMPKANGGDVEFVTELYPWVFWIDGTVLYGQKLYSDDEPVILAETNCTDVSAIRAMWSSTGGFDFGLVVFFILEGKLYYRQLIGGEWMDAEIVSFGPDGVTWSEVAAFRTWDYRIGVQAKSTDGAVYELFTQFMGVGKQLTEHIEAHVNPKANHIAVEYTNSQTEEHVRASVLPSGTRIYGLSSIPIAACNLDDGTGNYGVVIRVELDYPVVNVSENISNFSLTDGNGMSYACMGATTTDDGLSLILTFVDFNLAEGTTLTVEYTPGTIQSPATSMDGFDFTFTPENLVAPDIPIPEPVEAWNMDSEGTQIAVKFSESLVGDVSGITPTPLGYKQRVIDCSDVVVTTLNQYSASYSGEKAIDGSTSSYWRSSTTVSWIAFQFPDAKVVNHIRLVTNGWKLSTFTLSGSNDGVSWTQIGDVRTVSSTSGWNDFDVDNVEAYSYYRVDTITGSNTVCVAEIEFQESVPVGNETKVDISGFTYEYVPDGELVPATRSVTKISPTDDDHVIVLHLADGNVNNIQNMVGEVCITYSGGTLSGRGGPVEDFTLLFTPVGCIAMDNPGLFEHIETTIEAKAKLSKIHYNYAYESEHVEAVITPIGTLISIDDI